MNGEERRDTVSAAIELDLPTVDGRVVRLRPLRAGDYEQLRSMELEGDALHLYRHRSHTPAPEHFIHSMWADVIVNFAIVEKSSDLLLGNAVCYGADYRHGSASISMFLAPPFRGAAAAESAPLFLDYLFSCFPFRKLYADVLAPNLQQFTRVFARLFAQEAHYRSDVFVGGQYIDRYVYALWRGAWEIAVKTPMGRRGSQLGADIVKEWSSENP